ncbi:hypothetical protein Sango_2079500 [Sesamum angolense]|uniref:Uncharacterized protein n=1 Tax=Sesamum angolense TaxID=2727404 RepID=A0AAE1WBE2_9LAMI|nr:hypothetical protein Sango_2079500 [Sesamum angolense]
MRICAWIGHLKFPDGYTSNLARCVDMKEMRLHGMKSHDCHVFMLKFIPIVFREMLPEPVWSALIEVNLLLQILCSMTLAVNKTLCEWNKTCRNDELRMNDTRIHRSIFNCPDRACGA